MSTREYRVALQVREDLHPLASVSADQRWFWTERWQRMEREADEDIATGQVRAYENVDDLLAGVDR